MKNKTKKIVKEIAKDVGRGIAKVACKASYPILGNLSRSIQNKIEEASSYYYNGEMATGVSGVSNLIAYPSAAYFLFPDTPVAPMLGAVAGLAELAIRGGISANPLGSEYDSFPTASLPGKIISLPFDGLTYAYDAGKKYLQNVSERVESRERQPNLE